jgi:hypothetical protein
MPKHRVHYTLPFDMHKPSGEVLWQSQIVLFHADVLRSNCDSMTALRHTCDQVHHSRVPATGANGHALVAALLP